MPRGSTRCRWCPSSPRRRPGSPGRDTLDTYFQPNHIVRSFTTLDHLSAGRGAWNVVTSMNDSEGRMFGQPEHMDHDRRYDRADEFLEVAFKLWRSWDTDALIHDKASGFFVDPSRIHPCGTRARSSRSRDR